MTRRGSAIGVVAMLAALSACSRDGSNPAPPRVTAPIAIPQQHSAVAVPISADLDQLQRLAEAEIPKTLATIDREEGGCGRVKIIGTIKCHLVGSAVRGPIRLTGAGDTLVLTMPVSATISARRIAGIIKSETATAEAIVTARAKISIVGDWQPQAKVAIDYAWTTKPGIDFLGQRISFASKADPAVAKLIARLETDIPRQIVKLQPRAQLASVWEKGFTTVSINRRNPPAWMRITPQQLAFRGYSVDGKALTLNLALTALTETFVGDRPADPASTPLPPPSTLAIAPHEGFHFHLPVVADYAQLEPVLEKALGKLSKKPLELPGIGTVRPEFRDVTMYATSNGRLAIGLKMRVATPAQWIDARGTVWLTGRPYNAPGSRQVEVRDLQIAGNADSPSFRLLLAVAQSPTVTAELGNALSQDFERDFNKLLMKAGTALTEKRVGAFVLNARIDDVVNGSVYPAGQGVYMPVDATGTASLQFRPLKGK